MRGSGNLGLTTVVSATATRAKPRSTTAMISSVRAADGSSVAIAGPADVEADAHSVHRWPACPGICTRVPERAPQANVYEEVLLWLKA